jgi:hypothetical protein
MAAMAAAPETTHCDHAADWSRMSSTKDEDATTSKVVTFTTIDHRLSRCRR